MNDQIAAKVKQVAEIIHNTHAPLPAPSRTDGAWIVWDQWASRGLHNRYVAELKAAGIPAFFADRKFGIRK
jgi:hypothetical protein